MVYIIKIIDRSNNNTYICLKMQGVVMKSVRVGVDIIV